MTLTADYVRKLLDYDPATGKFIWRARRSGIVPGQTAGTLDSHGYRQIMIDGRAYLAHRLAWLHVHSEWPSREIDHINRVKDDNRICNLREATRAQSMANIRAYSRNTSGYKGVHQRANKKWAAKITKEGNRIHLGYFSSREEAAKAYSEAALKYHGEFACTE